MLRSKKEVSSFRTLIKKIRNYFSFPTKPMKANWFQRLRFRIETIRNWNHFVHVLKGYTIWNPPIMYFVDKEYRADVKYKRIINNIPKDYEWIEDIERVFDGSVGVNEYWLNVVLKNSHRKNPDIPVDKDGYPLWSIRLEFLKDLKSRVAKLDINIEDHDEIFQQMEGIHFSYDREEFGSVYE